MQKVSAGKEAATPGAVMASQVPAKTVQVPADTITPKIEDLTGKTEINQKEDLILTADAKDNSIVKTVEAGDRHRDPGQQAEDGDTEQRDDRRRVRTLPPQLRQHGQNEPVSRALDKVRTPSDTPNDVRKTNS